MKGKIFNLKKIDKLLLVFLGTILLSTLGLVFSRIGFHSNIKKEITYDVKKSIDYKVYLKPNNYFDSEYLSKNQTYITSLIDYINVDFEYDLKLSERTSGSYSYYIKAMVEANQINSDSNYFTKEYILSDLKNISYEYEDSVSIKDNINVDYQQYNKLLSDFKSDYGISMDGNLKVLLVIKNIMQDENKGSNVTKDSQLELNIPLTSVTVEVPIEVDGRDESGTLTTYEVKKDGIIYNIAKIVGIFFYIASFILILYLFKLSALSIKLENKYRKELKKILKTYDGIIVNLKKTPDINKNKLLVVSTFGELIDAYSEVRNPINYIEVKDGAIFMLISNGYSYYYKLDRELFTNDNEGDDK